MRRPSLRLPLAALLFFVLRTFLPCASAAPSDPRADFETLRRLHDAQPPPTAAAGSEAHYEWLRQRLATLRERGLAFLASFPAHPLRWDVLVLLRHSGPHEILTRADGSRYLAQSAVETALWNQRYFTLLEDLLESTDAGNAARHEALLQLIDHYTFAIRSATIDNPRRGILPALLDWVREFHRLDPRSGKLAYLYLRVARMLDALDPALCRTFLADLEALHPGAEDPDPDVRRNLTNFRRLLRNQDGPATELWDYLRRLEPRLGDFAPYRGKVVLVAYLAVDWSVHTGELERLYRKYHDAGLEIIQIAYRNRGPAPTRVQQDRRAMEEFVAAKGWPWPVLWEDVIYPHDFSRAWGLNSYPGFLVVGRDGRIVREVPGELRWDVKLPRELNRPAPAVTAPTSPAPASAP